jgi:hypothetical protein
MCHVMRCLVGVGTILDLEGMEASRNFLSQGASEVYGSDLPSRQRSR